MEEDLKYVLDYLSGPADFQKARKVAQILIKAAIRQDKEFFQRLKQAVLYMKSSDSPLGNT